MKFVNNLLIGLKGLVVSVVAGLVMALAYFVRSFIDSASIVMVLSVIFFVIGIWLWGTLANKFWKWK